MLPQVLVEAAMKPYELPKHVELLKSVIIICMCNTGDKYLLTLCFDQQ